MRAAKTRNAETLTEAAYWGKVRSVLRGGFRYWKPIMNALNASSRAYKGENKRQKKEYQCAICGGWFMRKNVEVDHIIPCGSLKCAADIAPFLERLTAEDPKSFQTACKSCHLLKSNSERKK